MCGIRRMRNKIFGIDEAYGSDCNWGFCNMKSACWWFAFPSYTRYTSSLPYGKKGKGHPCTGTEALYRHWSSVQALKLCTGRTAYRGSRGIALPFHDHGTRRGWVVSVTSRPLFNPGKDPVPIVQEAGFDPRAGLDRCGKSRPHWDSIPNRPARSQSLYRLSYPAHLYHIKVKQFLFKPG